MRTYSFIGFLLLVAACAIPADPAHNEVAANQSSGGGKWVVVEEPPTPAELRKCLVQHGKHLLVTRLKAVGTEPFWAAEVDGRCVLYKTPEDQEGTRFWTHVEVGSQGTLWSGPPRGRHFQLHVRPAAPAGCSDGMSDKTYPMEAVLRVDGETRSGCAEPL